MSRRISYLLFVGALVVAAGASHPVALRVQQGSAESQESDNRAESYTVTIPGTAVSFEMVSVPGGTTMVDTPNGGRTVAVGPFWMGRMEVTWDLYDVYLYGFDEGAGASGSDAVSRPSKPYVIPGAEFGHHGRPALAMTYHAATEFARWISVVTGHEYRLPTEAEWEYACRATAAEPEAELAAHAWYWDNAESRTHPGGQRKPNGFGLFDMLGNVAEWVTGTDGEPVVMGGSYDDDAEDVHCGARRRQSPAWQATDPQLPKSSWWLTDAPFVGFRLLREK